jgi:sulfoxide reductase heme-binding subunit YedZ
MTPAANTTPWLRANWHRLLAHGLALAPLIILGLQALAGALPINLERYLMLRSGLVALVLLVAAFAATPLTALTGRREPLQMRRALGVYAFLYALAHLLVYASYEAGFDLELIWRDLGERRAMAVGLIALAALLPLALTSTDGWQRRLGPRWRTLHRLVYLAVPLAVLHYYWLDRDLLTAPILFGALVVALFALRLPAIRQSLARRRRARREPAP